MPERALIPSLIALIAAAIFTRAALFHFFSKDHILSTYVFMPCRADALLSGVVAARFVRSRFIYSATVRGIILAIWPLLIIGTIVLAVLFRTYSERGMIFFGLTWLALLYAWSIVIVSTGICPAINAAVSARFLRWQGSIAYGVYLIHLPVAGLVFGVVFKTEPTVGTMEQLIVAAVSLGATLLFAHLCYFYFEQQFVALGHDAKFRFDGSAKRLSPAT